MLSVKVLGSGCANCLKLEQLVRQVTDELGMEAAVEKVTDFATILHYGVMKTPGLVVNERLLVSGRVPPLDEVRQLLARV